LPEQFWYSRRVKKALCPAFLLLLTALASSPAAAQAPPPISAAAQLPRKLAVVVIDPAHGGSDTGARGSGGTIESEVVIDLARAIRVALEAKGFRVVLTREGNQDPSFDQRSALVNGLPNSAFITLHVSSTGTPGIVRSYFDFLPPPPPQPRGPAKASPLALLPTRHPVGLLEWDRAQEPFLALSQRFAELVQIQLAQQFRGSLEVPSPAAVRQLRTVAAPAIAIEISSVVLDSAKLSQMGQPLGEAVARAVSAFQQALMERAAAQIPGQEAAR
jgi:N-acetylmuramoyl-L-alanine amidase